MVKKVKVVKKQNKVKVKVNKKPVKNTFDIKNYKSYLMIAGVLFAILLGGLVGSSLGERTSSANPLKEINHVTGIDKIITIKDPFVFDRGGEPSISSGSFVETSVSGDYVSNVEQYGDYPVYTGRIVSNEDPFLIKEYIVKVIGEKEIFVNFTIGFNDSWSNQDIRNEFGDESEVKICFKNNEISFNNLVDKKHSFPPGILDNSFVEYTEGEYSYVCSILSSGALSSKLGVIKSKDRWFSGVLRLNNWDNFQILFGTGSTIVEFTTDTGHLQSDSVNDVKVYDTADDTIVNPLWKFGGNIGKCAMSFDGSGDYLWCAPSSDWDLSNNNFTVSFWTKFRSFNGAGNVDYLIGKYKDVDGNRGWIVEGANSGSDMVFRYSTDGTNENTISATGLGMKTGVWYHIAVSRTDSDDTRIYIDGVQVGSTYTTDYTVAATSSIPLQMADRVSGSTQELNGWMDEIKIYNERGFSASEVSALYEREKSGLKSNDTTSLVGAWGMEDCPSASGTTIDESGNSHTGTLYGNAVSKPKSSWYIEGRTDNEGAFFDGTNDYITVSDSDDWHFGTGNFTIAGWINLDTLATTQFIASQGVTDTNLWYFMYHSSSGLVFVHYPSGGAWDINVAQGSTTGWAIDTWYHVALTRSGNTWTLYRDGNQLNQLTDSDDVENKAAPLAMGIRLSDTAWDFDGKMDNIRIYKGKGFSESEIKDLYARELTGDSTSAYDNDADLVGFWDFEDMDYTDDSGNANHGAGTGDVNISWVDYYTADGAGSSVFDGAAYMDGGNDYVYVPHAAGLAPSALTIDAWIKPATDFGAGGYFPIMKKDGLNVNAVGAGYNFMYYSGSPYLFLNTDGDASWDCVLSVSKNLVGDKWYHFVAAKNSSGAWLYMDGALVASSSSADCQNAINYLGYTDLVYIGYAYGSSIGNRYANGAIDELKLFNRAYSAQEVQDSYQSGLRHLASNVSKFGRLAQWDFNGDYTDDTGNGYDGTSANGAYMYGRSGSKVFPNKTYLIATDEGLDVLDANDDGLWMRFTPYGADISVVNMMGYNSGSGIAPYTGVAALNSRMYITKDVPYNYGPFVSIDLTEDTSYLVFGAGSADRRDYNSGISDRNNRKGTSAYDTVEIVAGYANDVSAAYINGYQYVAVATDGGVSVINETEGSVADLIIDANDASDHDIKKAYITSEGDCYFTKINNDNGVDSINVYYNCISDTTEPGWVNYRDYQYTANTLLGSSAVSNDLFVTEGTSTANTGDNTLYFATDAGVSVIQEYQGSESSGTVKNYTTDGSSNSFAVVAGNDNNMTAVVANATAMWIGTATQGVSQISNLDDSFMFVFNTSTTPSLLSNNISSLAIGSVLAGTDAGVSLLGFETEDFNLAPTHTTPILNATTYLNATGDNLTCYNQSTTDLDGESVKNIINWYKDGTSISVLNMPFEDSSNPTTDYSGYGNDGTVTGATYSATGGYDGKGAYEFDGVDDYIDLGDDSSLNVGTQDFSMSAWFKTGTTSGLYRTIVGKGFYSNNVKFYYMEFQSANLRCGLNNGSFGYNEKWVSTAGYNNGEWHHAVCDYDRSGDLTLYVDGISKATLDISSIQGNFDEPDGISGGIIYRNHTYVGVSAGGYSFNGSIDEVKIFNRSLSAEQVLALNNSRPDLIVSQETTKGEIWSCSITPNDGFEDGTTLFSNNLTIENSLPIQDNPWLGHHNMFKGNLTSEYRFETNAVDEMELNNGSVIGATITGSGRVGQAFEFDGVDDYIDFGDVDDFDFGDGDFTLALWVKGGNSGNSILMKDNYSGNESGISIYVDNNSAYSYWNGTDSINFTDVDGEWHHLVIRRNNFTIKGYLDGALNFTRVDQRTLDNTKNFRIGSDSAGTRNFNGTIDEVLIWNKALSSKEIRQLYNKTIGIGAIFRQDILCAANNTYDADDDPIKAMVNWRLNNQTISVLNMPFESDVIDMSTFTRDISGLGNNGTVNGATYQQTGGYDGWGVYYFDGTDDYISIPYTDSMNVNGAHLTLAAWSNVDSLTDTNEDWLVVQLDGIYRMSTYNSRLYCYIEDETCTYRGSSRPLISTDASIYHHYACEFDFDTDVIKYYQDGVSLSQTSMAAGSSICSTGTQNVRIGASAGVYTDGFIDEVKIYNRSLTPQQINAMYRNRTFTIVANETQPGQNWTCEMWLNDNDPYSVETNNGNTYICEDQDEDGFSPEGFVEIIGGDTADCGPIDCDDYDIYTTSADDGECDSDGDFNGWEWDWTAYDESKWTDDSYLIAMDCLDDVAGQKCDASCTINPDGPPCPCCQSGTLCTVSGICEANLCVGQSPTPDEWCVNTFGSNWYCDESADLCKQFAQVPEFTTTGVIIAVFLIIVGTGLIIAHEEHIKLHLKKRKARKKTTKKKR